MTPASEGAATYWEQRYATGGTSGAGSIGKIREWKWRIIRQYVGDPEEVLDVGCGDLSFWEGRNCASYVGIDIAPSVLVRNRQRRPTWAFIAATASVRIKVRRRVVFCLDLVFHILDDDEYFAILDNLCEYTGEWLFIFTWRRNPFGKLLPRIRVALPGGESRAHRLGYALAHPFKISKALLAPAPSTSGYQKYRPMGASLDRFRNGGLTPVAVHRCPYAGATGALYVFQRLEGQTSAAMPDTIAQ